MLKINNQILYDKLTILFSVFFFIFCRFHKQFSNFQLFIKICEKNS